MTLLDRYIAKQYLINIIALFVLLFSFVVGIDVMLNISRFLGRADELAGPSASTLRQSLVFILIVIDFWWPKLLQLFNFLLGMVLVAAMGFTFTQMVRSRELVAVLASGISLFRIARPILIIAALMVSLQIVNNELVLSQQRVIALLQRDHGQAGERAFEQFRVPLTRDSAGRVFRAGAFNPQTNTLENVTIYNRDADRTVTYAVRAPLATWQQLTPETGQWQLQSPTIDNFRLGDRAATEALPAPTDPAVTTIATDIDPRRLLLRQYETVAQYLSWSELSAIRNNPLQSDKMRQHLDRIRFGRIASIVSSILTLIIVMPFFLMREPRSTITQSLKAAPIGIAALVGGVFGATYDFPNLPAAFAVFIPTMILAALAVGMISSVKT